MDFWEAQLTRAETPFQREVILAQKAILKALELKRANLDVDALRVRGK